MLSTLLLGLLALAALGGCHSTDEGEQARYPWLRANASNYAGCLPPFDGFAHCDAALSPRARSAALRGLLSATERASLLSCDAFPERDGVPATLCSCHTAALPRLGVPQYMWLTETNTQVGGSCLGPERTSPRRRARVFPLALALFRGRSRASRLFCRAARRRFDAWRSPRRLPDDVSGAARRRRVVQPLALARQGRGLRPRAARAQQRARHAEALLRLRRPHGLRAQPQPRARAALGPRERDVGRGPDARRPRRRARRPRHADARRGGAAARARVPQGRFCHAM